MTAQYVSIERFIPPDMLRLMAFQAKLDEAREQLFREMAIPMLVFPKIRMRRLPRQGKTLSGFADRPRRRRRTL